MKCGSNYSTPVCQGLSQSLMIRKERRKRTSSRTRLRMGNRESAAPRETHGAESLQKLFGGAEGQNSDFRVWRCEEEGVGTGSWPGRGGG